MIQPLMRWVPQVSAVLGALLVVQAIAGSPTSSIDQPPDPATGWLEVQPVPLEGTPGSAIQFVLSTSQANDRIVRIRLLPDGFLVDTGKECVNPGRNAHMAPPLHPRPVVDSGTECLKLDRDGQLLARIHVDTDRLFIRDIEGLTLTGEPGGRWALRDGTGAKVDSSLDIAPELEGVFLDPMAGAVGERPLKLVSPDGSRLFVLLRRSTSPDSIITVGPVIYDRKTGKCIAKIGNAIGHNNPQRVPGWFANVTADGGFVETVGDKTVRLDRDGNVLWSLPATAGVYSTGEEMLGRATGQYVCCLDAAGEKVVVDAMGNVIVRNKSNSIGLLGGHFMLESIGGQWTCRDLRKPEKTPWAIPAPNGLSPSEVGAVLNPEGTKLAVVKVWSKGEVEAGRRRHFFKAVLVDAIAGKLLGSMDSSLVTAPLPSHAPADIRCAADDTVEFLLGTNLVQVSFPKP